MNSSIATGSSRVSVKEPKDTISFLFQKKAFLGASEARRNIYKLRHWHIFHWTTTFNGRSKNIHDLLLANCLAGCKSSMNPPTQAVNLSKGRCSSAYRISWIFISVKRHCATKSTSVQSTVWQKTMSKAWCRISLILQYCFTSHYQCNWLPGKTHLHNDLCGMLNATQSLDVVPVN